MNVIYKAEDYHPIQYATYANFKTTPINKPIQAIISRYCDVSQYLFPIVFSNDSEISYKEYRSWLRRVNKALKIIGERLNLAIPLTTYVARHSWATQAKGQGFPVSVIREGLGHCTGNILKSTLKSLIEALFVRLMT